MNNVTVNTNLIGKLHSVNKKQISSGEAALSSAVNNSANLSFKGGVHNAILQPVVLQTKLSSKDEQKKYNAISVVLDKNERDKLNNLLKSGRLLNRNSNDNSSVLDNLYNIAANKRMTGLSNKNILKETVLTLENPFIITQKFGDIPDAVASGIIKAEIDYQKYDPANTNLFDKLKRTGKQPDQELIAGEILNVRSNCCVAASIEFNLAHRMPAEFARIAEQLSSEKMAATKTIDLKAITENTVDSIWLLNEFKTKYRLKNWDKVEIELSPDRNAIVRARVQETYKDPGERSSVDVLMQSMLMQIGSEQTYNSLTDKRTGRFNNDNEGLTNIEKNYAEVLSQGKSTVLATYQIIDEDGKLTGYECDEPTRQKHITDALKMGENVIIGYTQIEPDGKINPDGHEITIVGIEKDKNGESYFVCKDTDNHTIKPIKYKISELLPKIHHAGLPKEVLKGNVEFIENWVEVLNQFKMQKTAK